MTDGDTSVPSSSAMEEERGAASKESRRESGAKRSQQEGEVSAKRDASCYTKSPAPQWEHGVQCTLLYG